jgi:hypothetical protein
VTFAALVGFSNTFYLTQVSTFIQQGVPTSCAAAC